MGEGEEYLFDLFSMFFGFSDHIWPAPLLAHTTVETVFWPNLCFENLGQWSCSVVVLCCVVLCWCGVCSKFSWVHPKFGRSPDSTPLDPSPDSTPSADPHPRGGGGHFRGFTRQPENSKRAHLRENSTSRPPEKEERIFWREREEKARNFGLPTLRDPTLLSSTLRPPPFGAPLFLGFGPHSSGLHPSGLHSGLHPFRAPPFRAPPFWPPPFGASQFGDPPCLKRFGLNRSLPKGPPERHHGDPRRHPGRPSGLPGRPPREGGGEIERGRGGLKGGGGQRGEEGVGLFFLRQG